MSYFSWLISGKSDRQTRRRAPRSKVARFQPRVEALEDRTMLSGVSFSTPLEYVVGFSPNSVVVADVDSSGTPDLVTNNGSVLLGDGNGTFRNGLPIADGIGFFPAAADFNGDGKPDLAAATGDNRVRVLLGNGDGTFQTAGAFDRGAAARSLVVGDFNGDGKADVAVGHSSVYGNGTVSVLLGNGDGTLQPVQKFAAGYGAEFLATGDFNGDGRLDLAGTNVSTSVAAGISVLLGNGDGTFQAAHNYIAIRRTEQSRPDLIGANSRRIATALRQSTRPVAAEASASTAEFLRLAVTV